MPRQRRGGGKDEKLGFCETLHGAACSGGVEAVAGPLARFANSVGADAGRLGARGVMINGELRSAQAQGAAPVWFVFSGARQRRRCPLVVFAAAGAMQASDWGPIGGRRIRQFLAPAIFMHVIGRR